MIPTPKHLFQSFYFLGIAFDVVYILIVICLGFWFVSWVQSKSCWVHLKSVTILQPVVSDPEPEMFIHAFVTSRLDYSNSLLVGFPDNVFYELLLLQNVFAEVMHCLQSHCSSYWLTVTFVKFRLFYETTKKAWTASA